MPAVPVFCTLQPGEINARAAQLLPGLAALATSQHRIEEGYRFEFRASGEVLGAIATAIDAERRCCRFLRFQLTVEPENGPIRLDITGPVGTAAFLSSLLENG
jgi:hypothetical protein